MKYMINLFLYIFYNIIKEFLLIMSFCTECNTSFNDLSINCPNSDFPFLRSIYCNTCNKSYVNCLSCNIYTVRLTGANQKRDFFKMHLNKHRLLQNSISSGPSFSTVNDSSQGSSSTLNNLPEVDFGSCNTDNNSLNLYQQFIESGQTFASQSSHDYMKLLLEHDTMALQKVVESSLSNHFDSFPGSLDKSSSYYNNLIHLHVVASIWINKLSKSNRQYFCSFISQLYKCFPDSVEKISYLPSQYKDLRSLYFDGKNSVLSKVPHPKVNSINGYAYVLFSDIILDLFTFKMKVEDHPNFNDSLSYIKSLKSKYLDEIFENNVQLTSSGSIIFILLQLWSDGFDPSAVKKTEIVFGYMH